jgi:hypothetical protein
LCRLKNSPRSISIRNSWNRTAPRLGLVKYPHHQRLLKSRVQQVRFIHFVSPADLTSPMDDSVKSPPPPASSHSRLVSTKLTKLPPSSAGTGSGWTRPSSTTPSLMPSPVSGSMSSVPPPAPAPVSHGPPQLPHAGKVIHPPTRGGMQVPSTSRSESANSSSKPAWRNVKQGGHTTGLVPAPRVQIEFPTAAEVAQGAFV